MNKRLQVAARRNRGKHLLSAFLRELACTLGRRDDTFRILSLDETDLLWQKVESKVDACNNCRIPCYRQRWVRNQLDDLSSFLRQLRVILPDEALILFRSASQYCGAVETSMHEVLAHALQLVSLDQEDLIVVDPNASRGMMLSFDTDKYITGDVTVYELIMWGEQWLEMLDFRSD